ncbi:MAG: hypothetical protein O9297_10770, partial [Flavobacterium sp.]|uniref:RHS repeat domain-containing protein n=1 Tax=Flavobacterium sp. TaxID=239 RepID=UPI0022C4772B
EMVAQNTSAYDNKYRFSGKELDEETGLSYFGARYYNPKWSIWLGVDPKFQDYPSWSPYNYCLQSPMVFKDPDGKDPITGIFEAISSFALSAGMDFMTGWLIEGKSANKAFNDIGWWSAGWDATKSYAIASFTPPGTATSAKILKLANSKAGKLTIGIMEKMTTKALDNYSKGNYNDNDGNFDFDKVNMSELFWESTIEALVEQGFGSKSDEVLATLKKENKALYQKLSKLEKKIANNKESTKRLNNYRKKVLEQAEKSNKATVKALKTKAKEKVLTGTTSKIINEIRKG